MVINIFCSFAEFMEFEFNKKYNLIDFGMSKRYRGYKWLRDDQKNINMYVKE